MSSVKNEHKKIEDFFKKSLDEFMKQYMGEDVPENERVVSYEMNGYGSADKLEKDGDIGTGSISFLVEPYSKESTIWTNPKERSKNRDYTCYIKFTKTNGEYEVQRISMIPEHYEEFMAEFEKYQASLLKENIETEAIQAKPQENYLASQEIQTMSHGIFIGCGILLLLTICMVVKMIRKRR